MLGISGIASKRPLDWLLQFGYTVWFIGESDLYEKETPINYRFIPSILRKVKLKQNKSGDLSEAEIEDLRPTQIEQLHQIVREFKPNIIHAHGFCFEVECCAIADIHPFIFSVWGYLSLEETVQARLDRKLYPVLKAADALIVESQAIVEKCQALVQPCPKTELIPLGVDTQHFRPYNGENVDKARQLLRIPQGAKVLLSPRVWYSYYRHQEILEAFAIAKPQFTHPTILLFILAIRGYSIEEIKSYYENFYKRAEELKISKQIYYLPEMPHDKMPFVYSLSDAIISLPKTDALASTLLEASACSKPIITVLHPSYKGTFIEEFCTLVKPNDTGDLTANLAAAMVKIVNQPEAECSQCLAASRQVVIEQYDETIMQRRLFQLYQELCK